MESFANHPEVSRIIQEALREDLGPGDYSSLSTIPDHVTSKARCLIKESGILAGVELAERVFMEVDPSLEIEVFLQDGTGVHPGDVAFIVAGKAQSILAAERLVLNLMQRMSGIATQTYAVVQQLEGLNCRVLDTRKTTPLIRHIEKWAVAIGGGTNHRFGLYDMVMIKDNHVDYAGGIAAALESCRNYLKENNLDLQIEIETRNLDEVREVLEAGGADRIMLDNMSLEDMRTAVTMINGQAEVEASGGITLKTIRPVAETGVDFVSMGALTHSVKSLDISLKAVKEN